MPRVFPVGMAAAVAAEGDQALVTLIELQFKDGTVRLCTAPHDLDALSATWSGIGGALGFESVEESQDASAHQTRIVISGVDQTVVAALLAGGMQALGRPAKVYLLHVDSTGAAIGDPLQIFGGRMTGEWEIAETPSADQPGTAEITATCTDLLGDLEQQKGIQTNVAVHQATVPSAKTFNDQGFSFVPALMGGPKVVWG